MPHWQYENSSFSNVRKQTVFQHFDHCYFEYIIIGTSNITMHLKVYRQRGFYILQLKKWSSNFKTVYKYKSYQDKK